MTKWLIDFDSTLSDTFIHQIERVNEKFGTQYHIEDFSDWGVENTVTREQAEYMWSDQVFLSEQFQIYSRPVPYAIEGIQRLLRRGDECSIVSDRPQKLYDVTQQWLRMYGLGELPLFFTRSVMSKSDQHVAIMTKAQIAYLYRLTHVVEDSPHHSYGLAKRSYIDKVYLLDKANNRHIEHEKITRVQSWKEIETG